jgi:type I restriction enzyme S subunit
MPGERLPAGWLHAPLSSLAHDITSGATPRSGDPRYYVEIGGIPFAKIDDLTASNDRFLRATALRVLPAALRETALKLYPLGTILVSMYGTVGLLKTAECELTANQALAALLPPFACDPDFLAHYLIWSRPRWDRFKSQTTQANINGRIVKAFQCAVPTPFEQRRIAEILDTTDEAISKSEQVIAKLQQVKQGLLHDLLTRGIDNNGELRDPERHPEQFQDSPLGWMPKDWSFRLLGDLLVLMRNGTAAEQVAAVTPYPVSRIETIADGSINWDRVRYLTRAEPRYLMEPGDILYSHINSVAHMGKVALYDGSRPLFHGMNLMLLRSDRNAVLPEFLHAILSSERGRAHARRECKAAVNQASLGQGDIVRFPLMLPSLEEQMACVERLAAHQLAENAEDRFANKMRALKSGLNDDLLTGRVCFPLNDEVAP